ncbi:hypothetical protein D3C76_218270 [compost metagenome]
MTFDISLATKMEEIRLWNAGLDDRDGWLKSPEFHQGWLQGQAHLLKRLGLTSESDLVEMLELVAAKYTETLEQLAIGAG